MLSDEELLKSYREGNVQALDQLVIRHRDALYGYIVNMTRNRAEADDAFQDTWMRAIRKLKLYKSNNFRGWLMRIARNTVIDHVRKKRPELSLDVAPQEGHSPLETIPGKEERPDSGMVGRDRMEIIMTALGTLPSEQREVFLMRTRAELSFKEIASIQRVSINTALARMQYALSKMRTILEPKKEMLL